MTRRPKTRQAGFTIIELMIATLVFSIVLVVLLTAFIRIGDLFYKGVSMMKTQEDTRNIVQSISDDIRFSKGAPSPPTGGIFCVGVHRYSYQLGHQLTAATGDFALKRDSVSSSASCNAMASGTNAEELLDVGMQLNALNVTCNSGRCSVNVHVVFYGGSSPDQFFISPNLHASPTSKAADAECNGRLTDTKLCAVADFNSTVIENI